MSARRSIDETLGKYNNYNINTSTARRWQTPPPPSPCILQLPKPSRTRRLSKRFSDSNGGGSLSFRVGEDEQQGGGQTGKGKGRGKLVALFGEEREFARSVPIVLVHPNAGHSPRRAKVMLPKSDNFNLECQPQGNQQNGISSEAEGAEKWGFQDWKFEAEVLRAECNLLRMEKEVAVRRWEEASCQMQHALTMAYSLHSAVQTLVTGRKKIVDEKNAQVVLQTTLENQIQTLQRKLHYNSEMSMRQTEINKCSNFDRQAVFLQRRLGKLRKNPQYIQDTANSQELQHRLENLVVAASDYSTESDREETPEFAEIKTKRSSPSFLGDEPDRLGDAALLKKRLDSLSMGMNESKVAAAQIRKEFKHMLSRSGECSSRRSDAPERAQGGSQEELCCQLCKATIRKIAAQVQAETDQWSQVQEILHHVREEMEELHKSRDLWEDRALKADAKIATLQAEIHEWREKAHTYSNKVSELQSETSRLRKEIEQVRHRHALEQSRWLCQDHSPRSLLQADSDSDSDSGSETKNMQISLPRIRASKFMQNKEQRLSFSGKRSLRRAQSLQLKENLSPKKRENEALKRSGKSCMASAVPLVDIGNTNGDGSA